MAKKHKRPTSDVAGTFLRGAVASGIVSAVQDKSAGAELTKAALLGGAALAAGAAVENLVFSEGRIVAKKGKRGKKHKHRQFDMTALEALLRGNAPTGLAALTPNQQLLVGILIGAGAAWVLGDDQMRAKLMRAGVSLYGSLAGGFEEMKEQLADVKAEVEAERLSAS